MNMQQKLTPESFELTKSLAEVYNASQRMQVIKMSDNVNGTSKHMLSRWINNLESILRDFRMKLPDAWRQTFEKELLNDEDSMQVDNCTTMIVQLPKGIKNQVESYIESLHAVYSNTQKE